MNKRGRNEQRGALVNLLLLLPPSPPYHLPTLSNPQCLHEYMLRLTCAIHVTSMTHPFLSPLSSFRAEVVALRLFCGQQRLTHSVILPPSVAFSSATSSA
eukprot:GHVT01013390.1.p1 GENE.GHVT01013390.1~~GHVT01013390.1.p1  ORF type:complete len:100 (-),score=7.94 GHVT01013390.1:366-665(-)